MSIDQRIIDRLQHLIDMGGDLLATRKSPPPNSIGFDSTVDSELGKQWATQSQNILLRVFGEDSPHYRNFSDQVPKITFHPATKMRGVLKAALDDYMNGFLFDVRRLVEAEVFDDFLGQAQHLLAKGYFQPAAVIAGAVLEDTLCKSCQRVGIPISTKPKMDKMNADLAKAGEYNKLTQKRITAIADIRNSAAHGKWDEFSENDVQDAIKWILSFVEGRYA